MADEFAGDLREIVAIQLWTAAASGGASAVGGWSDGGTTWAALVPVDATLLADIAERQIGRPRFRLTLRTPTVACVTSRFSWRGRTLAVLRAEPDPRTPDRLTLLVEDRT